MDSILTLGRPFSRLEGFLNSFKVLSSSRELKQIAKRVTHGIARTGTFSHNGSGEIFFAVSTATPQYNKEGTQETWKVIPKWHLDPIFKATVEATEEAIINALVGAEDMKGINDNQFFAVPKERLQTIMKKYNRLNPTK